LTTWRPTSIDHGWDVKPRNPQHRPQRTYRQSSKSTAEQREIDPFNKMCGRQGRFRLDAEFVRDNALAIQRPGWSTRSAGRA